MFEKLIVGRYIDLDVPPDDSILDGDPDHGFQRVRRTVLHIAESKSSAAPVGELPSFPGASVKVKASLGLQHAATHVQSQFQRQRVSALGVGEAPGGEAKAHRNFVWLPWLKGLVSEVSPEGFDLFTGPMSGCWIPRPTAVAMLPSWATWAPSTHAIPPSRLRHSRRGTTSWRALQPSM